MNLQKCSQRKNMFTYLEKTCSWISKVFMNLKNIIEFEKMFMISKYILEFQKLFAKLQKTFCSQFQKKFKKIPGIQNMLCV